jgi:probable F420-dependent oxidoreductase
MKLGVFLAVGGDPSAMRQVLQVGATTADRAGFHSMWFGEHVVLFDEHQSRYPYGDKFPIRGDSGLLEPFVAISFAAAVTQRIRLGTGICLLPQRSLLYTAKQVADCDVLSGGRFDFGVGIGWLREEFEALGASFEDRAVICRESIGAMLSLWTDPVSSHEGRLLHVPPVRMFPKPLQKPHPPIIFGGESDAALRRVGDLGQGWFGFNLMPHEVEGRIERLSGILSRRGRRAADVEVTISPYTKPGRNAEALRAYAEVGVDQVVYLVDGSSPAAARADIELLAADLLPVAASLEPRRR